MKEMPINILEADRGDTTAILQRMAKATEILHSLEGELHRPIIACVQEIVVSKHLGEPLLDEIGRFYPSVRMRGSEYIKNMVQVQATENWVQINLTEADDVESAGPAPLDLSDELPLALAAHYNEQNGKEISGQNVRSTDQEIVKEVISKVNNTVHFQVQLDVNPRNGQIIKTLLEERGKEYGTFDDRAALSQALKEVFIGSAVPVVTNWGGLYDYQREALEMIASKISRILNGNPHNIDSWQDIAGYATLVVGLLEELEKLDKEDKEKN